MECLDAEEISAMLGSRMSSERLAEVEVHLDSCSACRALLSACARDEEEARADVKRVPGDVIADRFVLERIVGEGGMGVVWAARDRANGQPVALKMLKIDTPELDLRARREAAVTAAIDHPNVLEVREVLVARGTPPILVMDLLDGRSLDRALAERSPLSPREAVAILAPLVSAVAKAHARGILHRDLKPQNVFLTTSRGVMLLDFGLAKLTGHEVDTLTRTGAILGTPHYMAPEQLYGELDIDRRADVWAIGAIAFDMLTGRRPLEGSSYAQLVRCAGQRRIPRVISLCPTVPARLAEIIDRMLSHDRADRPELAEVLAVLESGHVDRPA